MTKRIFRPSKFPILAAALLAAFSLHAARRTPRTTPLQEWRQVSSANIPRELQLLVGSETCFREVRAEIGDAALFGRMARLLKKHFDRYDRKTVVAALRRMETLQRSVDPVRAATDLTHIRSRVELVADKDPETWRPVLEMRDATIKELTANDR